MLTQHANPRVRAYARATGAKRLDHEYHFWIQQQTELAADAGRGAFRFDPGGPAHIGDHREFNAFLLEQTGE